MKNTFDLALLFRRERKRIEGNRMKMKGNSRSGARNVKDRNE
jgi:hypothetical protein